MEHLVLTDEEERIIQEGEDAQSLLDAPVFLAAIERVRNQCAEAILTSAPDKRREREDAYNLSRGLSAVTAELVAMASLGLATLENATRPATDADSLPDTPEGGDDY